MSTFDVVLVIAIALLAAPALWSALALPGLRRRYGDDTALGFIRLCSDVWCRGRHHVQFEGLEHLRTAESGEGVLVVSNHTGAVDPFLIQVPGRRLIHWMMASDMMLPLLDDLWRLVRVIPVDRSRTDAAALRRAVRLLKAGSMVGLFPEGRITRPRGSIRPFQDGAGLLATRCGAAVLPVLVTGTPDTDSTGGSLLGPSRSCVRFLPPMRFDRSTAPQEAAEAVRAAMARASGWPLLDTPMPLELGWSDSRPSKLDYRLSSPHARPYQRPPAQR